MEALHALMAPQTEQARKQPVQGLVTAKVNDRQDDGTYRLTYLTMGEAGTPSAPARVMMPMAGGNRGMYFFPEVGDEVVVAFEHGDTNFPIILGAVWNNNDPVPQQAKASSENNIKTIVSRSGHQLTFDDTNGAQQITLMTQGGHGLTLNDLIPGQINLASQGGLSVTLEDVPGKITLTASGNTVVVDGTGITLTSDLAVSITALGVSLNATGPTGIVMKATGPIALTSTASVALAGPTMGMTYT
jgi:phage baseplate assembly protein gpV